MKRACVLPRRRGEFSGDAGAPNSRGVDAGPPFHYCRFRDSPFIVSPVADAWLEGAGEQRPDSAHSARNAMTGSTRVARHAGIRLATSPTRRSVVAVAVSAHGSYGDVLKRSDAIT